MVSNAWVTIQDVVNTVKALRLNNVKPGMEGPYEGSELERQDCLRWLIGGSMDVVLARFRRMRAAERADMPAPRKADAPRYTEHELMIAMEPMVLWLNWDLEGWVPYLRVYPEPKSRRTPYGQCQTFFDKEFESHVWTRDKMCILPLGEIPDAPRQAS